MFHPAMFAHCARPFFVAATTLVLTWGGASLDAQGRDEVTGFNADVDGFSVLPFWNAEQSPADFLDIVGKNTKAIGSNRPRLLRIARRRPSFSEGWWATAFW